MKQKKTSILPLLSVVILMLSLFIPINAVGEFMPGSIVVNFESGTVESTRLAKTQDGFVVTGIKSIDKLNSNFKVYRVVKEFAGEEPVPHGSSDIDLSGYYILYFDKSEDLTEVIDAYRNDPSVVSVEPVGIHSVYIEPHDPRFGQQWGLDNTNDHDIYAPKALNG
jgi:hypothetical protein